MTLWPAARWSLSSLRRDSVGVKIVALSRSRFPQIQTEGTQQRVNFRVLPQLSAVVAGTRPARERGPVFEELPGLTAGEANVQFDDRVFPDNSCRRRRAIRIRPLPDFDTIGMSAGPKTVAVVNPDGQISNAMTFELANRDSRPH